MALLEYYTEELPKLNDRRGKVLKNSGTEVLRSLSDFLGSIVDKMHYDRLMPYKKALNTDAQIASAG